MKRVRLLLAGGLLIAGWCAASSCGGKVVADLDAHAGAIDAATDQPYEGEWCDRGKNGGPFGATPMGGGPTDSPTDASVFCGPSPYFDAMTHCRYIPGGDPPYSCCSDNQICCPQAVALLESGKYTIPVGACIDKPLHSNTHWDCSACCNGIGPGPAYTGAWDH